MVAITITKKDKKMTNDGGKGFIHFLMEAFALEAKSCFRIVAAPIKSLRDGSTKEMKEVFDKDVEDGKKLIEKYCGPMNS